MRSTRYARPAVIPSGPYSAHSNAEFVQLVLLLGENLSYPTPNTQRSYFLSYSPSEPLLPLAEVQPRCIFSQCGESEWLLTLHKTDKARKLYRPTYPLRVPAIQRIFRSPEGCAPTQPKPSLGCRWNGSCKAVDSWMRIKVSCFFLHLLSSSAVFHEPLLLHKFRCRSVSSLHN